MQDTKKRSWVKSIVWRIIGIFLLGAIAYLVTGDWAAMTLITLIFHGIRVIMYYWHERIWERVKWGKVYKRKEELAEKDQEKVKERLKSLGYL